MKKWTKDFYDRFVKVIPQNNFVEHAAFDCFNVLFKRSETTKIKRYYDPNKSNQVSSATIDVNKNDLAGVLGVFGADIFFPFHFRQYEFY